MGTSIFTPPIVRAWQLVSKFYKKIDEVIDGRKAKQINAILNTVGISNTSRAEEAFADLQAKYVPRSEYGYDPISVWRRATSRSINLVSLSGMETSGKQILDVGAGDGMLGAALNAFGHSTTLVDLEDWRHESAKKIRFEAVDCCKKMPFADATFDLVCSFNSFEHFPTPETVFAEILRLTKPGGWIYTEFNPLYASSWGLHAYRALRMPYPQFLFSDYFIEKKLKEIGIWDLGKKRTELQFLNKWKLNQFNQLWNHPACKIIKNEQTIDSSNLELILRFPEAFRGRGLSIEDLTVSGIIVSIQKK